MNEAIANAITTLEDAVLDNLRDLEPDWMKFKRAIARDTGIPTDILTVILRRLKLDGRIMLQDTWDGGMLSGSGYRLQHNKKDM